MRCLMTYIRHDDGMTTLIPAGYPTAESDSWRGAAGIIMSPKLAFVVLGNGQTIDASWDHVTEETCIVRYNE